MKSLGRALSCLSKYNNVRMRLVWGETQETARGCQELWRIEISGLYFAKK